MPRPSVPRSSVSRPAVSRPSTPRPAKQAAAPLLGPIDAASLLLILVAACYVGAFNGHYSYDDAFITFRMAEHFARGVGFVYNPGEWHLGSTAAFYGLTLGTLGALFGVGGGAGGGLVGVGSGMGGGVSIPAIAGVLSTMSVLATGWLLYGLGRTAAAPWCGLVAGLFYVTNPMIFVTFGGEMPFQLALVTGAFFALRREARTTATVLAALAILTRPDGVLAAAVLLTSDVVRRRRVPWREIALGALILLPFVALAWYAYGSPLPSTLAAKLAQRDSGLWSRYGRGLIDWIRLFVWDDRGPNMGFAPVAPPTLWLWIAVGAASVWRTRYRVFWPLLAWSALFVASYSLLRVPFYHWYAAPAVLGLVVLAGCGLCTTADLLISLVSQRIGAPLPPRALLTANIIVVVIACTISLKPLLALPRTSTLNPTVNLYIHAGRWLNENTPRDASVGYYEIGYIGFYGHRRMIDSLGLIDPQVSPAVARHDFSYAFRQAKPDFILEKRGAGLNGFLGEPWFKAEYRDAAILSIGGRSSEALIVHQRVTPVAPGTAPAPAETPAPAPRP